jgi:glycosyltransferase involved in cell wall biosynthesis
MKKMLFLSPELPYPLHSGGKIKTWHTLEAFSKYWDITLVCPLKLEDNLNLKEFKVKSSVKDVLTDKVNRPRSAYNLLKSWHQRRPINVLRTDSRLLKEQVANICHHQDYIFIDHFEAFQFVPSEVLANTKRQQTIIYHAHNAYHKIWERFAKTTTNLAYKIVCNIEAKRIVRYERHIVASVDCCFAAPNDVECLTNLGCCKDKLFQTLHLGDESALEKPALRWDQTTEKLCYLGYLGWEPNIVGLEWFLTEVWPVLKQRHPKLSLDIAGKNADQRLKNAVQAAKDVTLLGYVEDLEDIYSNCRISIAPLLFGSGIKVKVISAMARGLPLVTTSIGAEGLEVKHQDHLMIADSSRAMAGSITQLLQDDILWQRIASNSRKIVIEKYTWAQMFSSMIEDINSVAKSRHSVSTPLINMTTKGKRNVLAAS